MEVTISRVRSAGFTTAMGSGITIIGPSPDGFFHLTFWRDSVRLVHERFQTSDPQATDPNGQTLVPVEGGQLTEMFREEVATILMPVSRFPGMVETLGKVEVPDPRMFESMGTPTVGPA